IINLIKKSTIDKELILMNAAIETKIRCIDLTYLLKRTKSDPTLTMEIISLYLEQTPFLINIMKESIQNKDWISLKSSVHKIIPSFSVIGLHKNFEEMAKKIQVYA